MAKTRKFSIYLLKSGFGSSRALKTDHVLTEISASALKSGWKMYVSNADPRQPWWRDYFGVSQSLNQSVQGGLVFLKAGQRNFALSFGTGHNSLKDESYEYDFGLRVTLNCVDPDLIRNTDVLDPGTSRRQRTQVASLTDLTYFDFDSNRSILRTLTGSSREEYRHLTKHVTGASNLKIGSDRPITEIPSLLEELLDVYDKETYKTAFPDLQNIVPVRDPGQTLALDELLVGAVRDENASLILSVPSIINYNDNYEIMFGGIGASKMYEDAEIADYYDYLADHDTNLGTISVEDLRHHELRVVDENGQPRDKYSVYRSLVFETNLAGDDGSFHLSEGQWYRVERDFIKELRDYLDPRCAPSWLPQCSVRTEKVYNREAVRGRIGAVNLDMTDISPKGQSQIEPCDIYSTVANEAVLTHVKIGTDSSVLSHLFAQGANSIRVLRLLGPVRDKLTDLVKQRGDADADVTPISSRIFRVEYAIVTAKEPSRKSDNLPFFSRLSLRRVFDEYDLMGVPMSYGFVHDEYTRAKSRKKPRKPRAAKAKT